MKYRSTFILPSQDERVVTAVKATQRQMLVIALLLTEMCLAMRPRPMERG
jgi:hypothetical protein